MKSLGPFFPLYWDDFKGGTMHFSAADIGAYILMLGHQWDAKSVPSESRILGRITRRKPSQLTTVLEKFELDENGNYVNRRMEEIRNERLRFLEKQSAAGKASAAKRAGNTGSTDVQPPLEPPLQPEGQPEGNLPSPSPKELSKSHSRSTPRTESATDQEKAKVREEAQPHADRFNAIIAAHKNIKWTAAKTRITRDAIADLHRLDGVEWDRVTAVLDWYAKHIGEQYVPVAESGKAFREKFTRLESAMSREQPEEKKQWHNVI